MEKKKTIDKVIDKVFNDQTECHFANQIDGQAVCSPKKVINRLKEFVKSKDSKNIASDKLDSHIVEQAKELLNCSSESCILQHPEFVKFSGFTDLNHILEKNFKPSGPATNFGLLSNYNIDDVLEQFKLKFSDRKFLHVPFQMRDFSKQNTELNKLNLEDTFKTYDTFAVVINTDYSDGKGIHWFCLFGERYKDHIDLEYFNSSGKPPLIEILEWLHKHEHLLKIAFPKLKINLLVQTGIRYQDDDHSCGVYCLAYIWLRLEKIPVTWFKEHNFMDALMHKLRKNLFRWMQ